MSNYIILTDSTTDLSPELISELDVNVIPMQFTADGKTYYNHPDGKDLAFNDFYNMLRSGKTSNTSLINTAYFLSEFEKYVHDDQDILYLSFSSGLSGTYNCSITAIEMIKEKYPNNKIISVDTLAASMGEGLIVYHAAKLRKEGKSIEEVAKWVEDNRLKLCHWFTVDDLHHLQRGGRVSAVAATFGTLLNIKPVLHVDNEGHLIPMDKIRGRKQSIIALFNKMKETVVNPEEQTIFISHGDALEDAEYLADMVKKELNVKKIYMNYIGPVIGSHSGPGTIALFFLGTHR